MHSSLFTDKAVSSWKMPPVSVPTSGVCVSAQLLHSRLCHRLRQRLRQWLRHRLRCWELVGQRLPPGPSNLLFPRTREVGGQSHFIHKTTVPHGLGLGLCSSWVFCVISMVTFVCCVIMNSLSQAAILLSPYGGWFCHTEALSPVCCFRLGLQLWSFMCSSGQFFHPPGYKNRLTFSSTAF